jgi:hypothetical protein
LLIRLSRIFGVIGGALALLPYVLVIGDSVIELMDPHTVLYQIPPGLFILRCTAPALLSLAGIIAVICVRKKSIFAGIAMIASYTLNSLFPCSGFLPEVPAGAARVLSALLLVSGGVLAFVSAGKASSGSGPQSGKQKRDSLLNLSRIVAVVCAALSTLFWVVISIYALCSRPLTQVLLYGLSPLFVSAAGLWGCLTLRRRPAAGAMLTLVSGVLIFLFSLVPRWLGVMDLWYGIPSLPLIIAGSLTFIAGKASKKSQNESSSAND